MQRGVRVIAAARRTLRNAAPAAATVAALRSVAAAAVAAGATPCGRTAAAGAARLMSVHAAGRGITAAAMSTVLGAPVPQRTHVTRGMAAAAPPPPAVGGASVAAPAPGKRNDELGDLLDILGASDDEDERRKGGDKRAGGRKTRGASGSSDASADAGAGAAAGTTAPPAGGRKRAVREIKGPAMQALVDADGGVLPLASEDESAAPRILPDEAGPAAARRAAKQLAYHRRALRATTQRGDMEEYAAALERELGSDLDADAVDNFSRTVRQDEYPLGEDPLLDGV